MGGGRTVPPGRKSLKVRLASPARGWKRIRLEGFGAAYPKSVGIASKVSSSMPRSQMRVLRATARWSSTRTIFGIWTRRTCSSCVLASRSRQTPTVWGNLRFAHPTKATGRKATHERYLVESLAMANDVGAKIFRYCDKGVFPDETVSVDRIMDDSVDFNSWVDMYCLEIGL